MEPQRPPRVLFLSYTFQPEPGVTRGLPLARYMQNRGFEVTVLTGFPQYPMGRTYPGYKQEKALWEEMDGVKVLRVPIFPSHDRSAAKRVLTYVSFMQSAFWFGLPRVGEVDLVYYFDNLPTTGWVSRQFAFWRDAITIQHIADMWPDTVLESGMLQGAPKRFVEGPLTRSILRMYREHKFVSVLSPGFKRTLIERGVPEDKVWLIYNWAEEDLYKPAPRDPELRRELGFDGKVTVLYAGNIGPMQSLHTAVEAAAMVKDSAPDFQLVLMGTGPEEAHVKRRAEELGASNVRFMPYRPASQMNSIYPCADGQLIHLMASELMSTTIPNKTQVTLATGRPALIGATGDPADLIRRGEAGLVFPPQNAGAMADAFRTFAAMPEEQREAMGRSGRAFYEREMSFEVGAKITERMFRAALGMEEQG